MDATTDREDDYIAIVRALMRADHQKALRIRDLLARIEELECEARLYRLILPRGPLWGRERVN